MSERSQVKARARSLHELLDRHLHSPLERAQMAELQVAGINRHRISTLYPGELLDLAPHLEVLMRKSPVPVEARRMDEALVKLSVRNWAYMTLHVQHAHQLLNVATGRTGYIDFGKGRLGAVGTPMSLRGLLALINLLNEDAFEAAGEELPWGQIDTFLIECDASLHLIDQVLTEHPLQA